MAELKGVVVALASLGLALAGLSVAAGVPLHMVVPPLWTIAAIVLAPLLVIAVSTLLPSSNADWRSGQRRAAAANAPRPRRNGGTAGGSTPGRFGVDSISGVTFELSDGPTR